MQKVNAQLGRFKKEIMFRRQVEEEARLEAEAKAAAKKKSAKKWSLFYCLLNLAVLLQTSLFLHNTL